MHFQDEFLPTQFEYDRLWEGKGIYDHVLFNFIAGFNGHSDYSDLDLELPPDMTLERMASNPISISLLQMLISIQKPHWILEIGTFIGVSAIRMAQAMEGGHINTVEKGKSFAQLAIRNISRNTRTGTSIAVHCGDAFEFINSWTRHTALIQEDMIFLDADKEHYHEYLEPLTKLLRPGGLLIVDDVLFHGDVLNQIPKSDKGLGVKKLLDRARALPWRKALIPLANGILIMQKPV